MKAFRSKVMPAFALALVLGLSGCGGGGDGPSASAGQPERAAPAQVEEVALLETAHGGPDGLRQFFDTHSEDEIRAELASYGIGYRVHGDVAWDSGEATTEPQQDNDRAQPQAISSCVRFYPSSDRVIWHNINGEFYYIDGSGRPSRAYADLPPISAAARQDSCQTSIGQWGDAENPSNDYDGGHLIGSQLGGWGGRANIVPQDANFNRGNWAQLENKMAGCGSLPSGTMRYSVTVGYSNSTKLVPSSFGLVVTRRSNGANVSLSFSNTDYGGGSGTSERTRGTAWLSNQGCT